MDATTTTGTAAGPVDAPPRPPWRPRGAGELVVLVAIVLLAVLLVAAIVTGFRRLHDGRPLAWWASDDRGHGADHVVSGGLDGARDGEFEVVGQATTVTVRASDLGSDAYRVSTPDDAGIVPRMVRSGHRLQLHLPSDPDHRSGGPGAVEVRLDPDVRWKIRFTAGAVEHLVDMGGGKVSGVELAGGVTRAELTLPRPSGTVPIQLTGGAGQLLLHVPGNVPARVAVASGAGTVVVDGASRGGVGAGTVFTPPDWESTDDRYDVQAMAGVSVLTVDHR